MRRGAAVLGWGLLAGLMGACQSADPPGEPSPTVRLDVTFEATVTTEPGAPGQLVVRYRLGNPSNRPVVALDGVPETDTVDEPRVHPRAVYVSARPDGTVELSRRAFALPDGVNAAAPFQVAGSVVGPESELAGEIGVPLPLRERHPYLGVAGRSGPVPGGTGPVVFCLGVLPGDMVALRRSGSEDRPVYGHMDFTVRAQQLLCSDPAVLPRG
jgi:hypothetical protein